MDGHKWAGILAAIPILILASTGLILVFESELRAFEEREAFFADVPEGASEARLSIQEQVDRALEAYPDLKVSSYSLPKAPDEAAMIRLSNRHTLFVDPYTGEVRKDTPRPAPIMRAIRVLHTSFFLGDFGTWIAIISSFAFILLSATGAVLFFKRRGNLLRQSKITFDKGANRRDFDLHAVIGFYAAGFLSLIALSGALIGIGQPWREFILNVTQSEWAARPKLSEPLSASTPLLAMDVLLEAVNAVAPEKLEPTTIFMPREADAPVLVRYTYPWARRPASLGYIHPATGAILDFHHFPEYEAGHLIHRLNRGFHSGEIFTVGMRWLWWVLMLITLMLIITGYFIWRTRRKKQPQVAQS